MKLGSISAGVGFSDSQRRTEKPARFPSWRRLDETPYADDPKDLHVQILELYERYERGATVIAKLLRIHDGITVDNNTVHAILQEYEHVTENPNKQCRKRPWVRWKRDFSLVTVHMDWYRNSHEQWVLGAEDDASRKVLGMIETDPRSAQQSVELLDEVRRDYAETGEILEVINDHGSEFYAPNRDQ